MLAIGGHAFTDIADFTLCGKMVEKLCVPHGCIQNVSLKKVLYGAQGIHSEKDGWRVERVVVEKDAFAGGLLGKGPFFSWKSLRCISLVEMVEIIDAAGADGIVRMGFHEVELLLKFMWTAPEVIPFAHGDVFALRMLQIDEIETAMTRYGMKIGFT